MSRRHRQVLGLAFLAGDVVFTSGAWFAAYFLRFEFWSAPRGVPQLASVASGWLHLVVLALLAYLLCGLHQIHRLRKFWNEAEAVVLATGLLFLFTITLTFYRRDVYESRLGLGLFLVLNPLFVLSGRRLAWKLLAAWRRSGASFGRALLVGGGRTGRLAAETIRGNDWTCLEIAGYVDDAALPEPAGLVRLGGLDDLPRIIEEHQINHVFISLPLARYGELPRVYELLSHVLVEVHLVADVPSFAGMKVRTMEVDGVPFVSLRENPCCGWRKTAKRATDLLLGGLAVAILSPLMLGLAALVKLTSRGPVFYRQARAGLGGRTFEMLKFRSMQTDAEAQTGAVWATRDDDRCTALGRFMRKWSLDELPQLFNVLAGDMSLVGPRPERGVFIEKFQRQVPNYAQRHQVKAGITGWAQVNGWRGNTSLRRRVECDLYYICNWSFWLDVKILFLTLWRGFRHKNAY
jgi:Undecaprenyl-phosphate glucose phosphotransferase